MRAFKISLIVFILSITLSAQNFWHQTNGPYGGATVNDFLLYKDSTLFLATDEGLIKSSDDGNNWIRINSYNVTSLSVDKFNTLYYGISGHLKRSTDDGNTWIDITVWGAAITDFAITYKDTIIVGSWDAWSSHPNGKTNINEKSLSNGVFRSFDYGATWVQVNNGIVYPGVYEIIILSNGSLLIGTSGGGVYKSTNWGDLWTASNNGISGTGYLYAESFCETTPGNVFTGTFTGIYYSTNYGDSWVYKSTGCTNKVASCIVEDDYSVLYAGTRISSGVYYSTNNGNNWYYLGLGHSIYTIGWDSDSRLYAGGSGDGLYRFVVEDSTWSHVYNQGYTPVQVDNISLTENRGLLANTRWWGLHYSSDDGETWIKTNYMGNEPNDITTLNDSIFTAGGNSQAYVSYDYGTNWFTSGNFLVYSLYTDQLNQEIYLGTDYSVNGICGIYRSGNFGQSWDLIYSFQILSPYQRIIELYASSTSRLILASIDCWSGPPSYSDYYCCYRSTDYGQSWDIIYQDGYYSLRQIIKDDSNTFYALANNKLLVSENWGNTWITKSIPGSDCIAADHSGRIFRAYGILYYSTDRGDTWIEIDYSGLESSIDDIVINENNKIFVATFDGIYYCNADSIVLSTKKIEPVKSFYMSQNYPNPFNPTTRIKYEIPERSFVTIKIYDVLGNEVITLLNEEKSASTYEVEFDGTGLTSGIYFYQLKVGSFVETKKMILLK